MRLLLLLLAGFCALMSATASHAGPNPALCLAIQNNFNNCMRHNQWLEREAEEDWDDAPWWRHRHRGGAQDCNAWLFQLKANGCV